MIAFLLICTIMAFNHMTIGQEVAPPQGKCPANSTMSGCGNRCEAKCGDPPGGKPCVRICDPPACACAKGYARNSSNQCVLVADCNEVSPNDDPCAVVRCRGGTHCVPRPVQCKKAPCRPVAACVPDEDVCAAVDCVSGYVCVPHEVQCIRAPCPPIAECVPASSASSRADGREEADSADDDD